MKFIIDGKPTVVTTKDIESIKLEIDRLLGPLIEELIEEAMKKVALEMASQKAAEPEAAADSWTDPAPLGDHIKISPTGL